jgi:hypothetical protein
VHWDEIAASRTIVGAFTQAAILAVLAIAALLIVVLRRPSDVARVILLLLFAGLLAAAAGVGVRCLTAPEQDGGITSNRDSFNHAKWQLRSDRLLQPESSRQQQRAVLGLGSLPAAGHDHHI